MKWEEIRINYPNKFIVMEGIKYHSADNIMYFDDIAVLYTCDDGEAAWKKMQNFHRQYPSRKFYLQHTKHSKIEIVVRKWLGVRR